MGKIDKLKRILAFLKDGCDESKKHEEEIERLSMECKVLASQNIDLRLQLKKLKQEQTSCDADSIINIVFICHRPAVWGSLKKVYEIMKNNNRFNVHILAIPNKKEIPGKWLHHEEYESEGAEEFWTGDDVICGYNYETHEWFDLKSLAPDYVFYQQPYDVMRCPQYKSSAVSKYAKICFNEYFGVSYLDDMMEQCTPLDFLSNLSFYFAQNEEEKKFLIDRRYSHMKYYDTKIEVTGFPRYDDCAMYKGLESSLWSLPRNEHNFRVLWTPRWTTNEGNCHFFDYKDKFLKYADENDTVDFLFRPHPQAFAEWRSTGELPEEEAESYKQEYKKRKNTNIDLTKDYIPVMYSSDVLVTDKSSMLVEYFLTDKPVIFCKRNYEFEGITKELARGFYCVESWEELYDRLEKLRRGEDELFDTRQEIIKKWFYIPKEGAANNIVNIIAADAGLTISKKEISYER